MTSRLSMAFWSGLLVALFSANMAWGGHGASPVDSKLIRLGEAVEQADFIFRGTVIDVQSRLSDVESNDDVRLPHTFVTLAIEESLKGDTPLKTITLRFLGGYDKERDAFLSVGGAPMFNIGDHDILMVKNNGASMCPIVGCGPGRFRIVGQRLYSYDGRQVMMRSEGILSFGAPAPKNDLDVMKLLELPLPTPYLSEEEEERYYTGEREWPVLRERNVPKPQRTPSDHLGAGIGRAPVTGGTDLQGVSPRVKTAVVVAQGAPLSPSGLAQNILKHVSNLKQHGHDNTPIISADINETFVVRHAPAIAPSGQNSATSRAPRLPAPDYFDLLEERIVHQQGGNPVVK